MAMEIIIIKIRLYDTADGPNATEREKEKERIMRIIKEEVEATAECVLIVS